MTKPAHTGTHVESHIKDSGIKEIVFGAEDGIVTTLGVVLGVSAAATSSLIIIVAGLAAMLAEAISMGVGSYLSVKSEKEIYDANVNKEIWEMKHKRDVEIQEVRDIYYKKGFRGKLLEGVVKKIISNKKLWLEEMLVWELGIMPHKFPNPIRSATLFFLSSLLGIIPIVPFLLLPIPAAIAAAIISGFAVLFIVGAAKTRLTKKPFWKSGLEMLVLGILAALAGYGIGVLLGASA